MNTSTDNDKKTTARNPGTVRAPDAAAPAALPATPALRTVLVAACGWPTEVVSVSRRRSKPRGAPRA